MKSYQIQQETDKTVAKRISKSLSKAFFEEPNFTYVLPDKESREKELQWIFKLTARLVLRYGTVYTDLRKDGSALWLGPDQKIKPVGSLMEGMLQGPFKLGPSAFYRFITLGNSVDKLREQVAPEDHWYLVAIGVNPGNQSKGLGSALLQPVLSKSKANNLPCYLETFSRRTFPFYEKHGFNVIEKSKVGNDGPEFWAMLRR